MSNREAPESHPTPEQIIFILEDPRPLQPGFLGRHHIQVSQGQVVLVYRDGLLWQRYPPGPHGWWNGFRHKYKTQRINMHKERFPVRAQGRVKGPPVPNEVASASASAMDLACDVRTDLALVCQIQNVDRFMEYRQPLSVFEALVANIVVETIGLLQYDQYGNWATQLRNGIRTRLMDVRSPDNAIARFGLGIEDVLVTGFKPNSVHDRAVLAMFQLVEKARRELSEAQAQAQRDQVAAESYEVQGAILGVSPALLALQNSSIGKELIKRDAQLKRAEIYATLNPGDAPPGDRGASMQIGGQSVSGYLRPAQLQPPPRSVSVSEHPSTFASGVASGSAAPGLAATSSGTPPVDPARQSEEIQRLKDAGFEPAGTGQNTPASYDQGRPGAAEWVLQVYETRQSGSVLEMVFHCRDGYPAVPPAVQYRSTSDGALTTVQPAVVTSWNPGRYLADVAHEVSNMVED